MTKADIIEEIVASTGVARKDAATGGAYLSPNGRNIHCNPP